MERLRGEGGCPWDRKQSFETLRTYIVEEAYELVEAITSGAPENIKEESGDLLLQIVFLSTIAKEKCFYDINDVINNLCDKLIRRHPHVFADESAEDSDEVLRNWERIKLTEKAADDENSSESNVKSILSGVPSGLPALLKAYRIQEKAAHVGFDWERGDTAPIFEKIQEEIREIKSAMDQKDAVCVEEEIGDLLFAGVNLARHLGVNPDVALGRTNAKFMLRFSEIEKLVAKSGRNWADFSLDELDNMWNIAKKSVG
jgi:MazG family protein